MKITELSKEKLNKYTSSSFLFDVRKTITSTNSVLKEAAKLGAPEKTVIIAEEQTSGRGRLGRSFYSPANTGIYMSLLLYPKSENSDTLFITTAAAVAVCRAIEAITDKKAGIKWVNDIYCDGKKVCGILAEAGYLSGKLNYVVLGIGINVNTEEFPEEIKQKAGALGDNICKNKLAAKVLDEFVNIYENGNFIHEYRSRSILTDKIVTVSSAKDNKNAKVIGIDNECKLEVEFSDGTRQLLSFGEVNILMNI